MARDLFAIDEASRAELTPILGRMIETVDAIASGEPPDRIDYLHSVLYQVGLPRSRADSHPASPSPTRLWSRRLILSMISLTIRFKMPQRCCMKGAQPCRCACLMLIRPTPPGLDHIVPEKES